MTEYLIALGSNLPLGEYDLTSILQKALDDLDQIAGVSVARVSHWYRTPAWPEGSGPDFVNGAAALRSQKNPKEILQDLHGVEKALGRERRIRWGARTCDLDLIGAEELVLPSHDAVLSWINSEPDRDRVPAELLLPHPRLQERAFVLVPLCDVAPGWVHPVLQHTAETMQAALPEVARNEVVRLDSGSSFR
ncbi:MAG: 2-amino-4-hydroxy-6-hydroxymethyldihydropteridine diphosphokinase [Pseudomonadota bacterium]